MKRSPLGRVFNSNQSVQQSDDNFIPFKASTPHHNRNEGNWRQSRGNWQERRSNWRETGGNGNCNFSGGYNKKKYYGNQRQSPYSPYNNAKQFGMRAEEFGNRSSTCVSMKKYVNFNSAFEDPWKKLENNLTGNNFSTFQVDNQVSELDSSTDVITESSILSQESGQSFIDDSVNSKDQSSVELEFDSINFSKDSTGKKSLNDTG